MAPELVKITYRPPSDVIESFPCTPCANRFGLIYSIIIIVIIMIGLRAPSWQVLNIDKLY